MTDIWTLESLIQRETFDLTLSVDFDQNNVVTMILSYLSCGIAKIKKICSPICETCSCSNINPFTAMWPTSGSLFAFHIFISKYIILNNSINDKMQRKKLYNSHRKFYCSWIMHVINGRKTRCNLFSRLQRCYLFLHECEIPFFLLYLFILEMIFLRKNKI